MGDRSLEILLFVFRLHRRSWVQTSLSSDPSAALQVTEMATGFCPIMPGPGGLGQGPTPPPVSSGGLAHMGLEVRLPFHCRLGGIAL